MAAALFRRGAGLCCIHRELCRAVWRPQTALFSSKPPDIKQPRWTHIKKAKPQPAVDVATLLEQLFPHHRPGTAPPVARPAEASFMPNKPPIASSVKVSASNVPPLSKTEPEASVSPAASSLKQVDARRLSNVTVPTTSGSSSTSATSASLASEVAAIECQTLMETIETKVESATEPVELKTATALPLLDRMVEEITETSSSPAATVEPLIETTIESPVEHIVSPVVVEGPVEPTVEAPAEEVQTKVTDSGVVDVLHAAEEPLIETTIESPVEGSNSPVETHETRAAVVEGPVEPTMDVTVDVAAQKVETKSTDSGGLDISHITTVEPLIETTIEPAVEKSISLLEALEDRSAVAEGSVETTLEAEAVTAALSVQTNSTDSVPLSLSHAAEAEPLIETTIESQVDVTVGTLETRAAVVEGPVESTIDVTVDVAAHTVETTSTDSGVVNVAYSSKDEPLIETTIEPAVEASTSPVCEGILEPAIETEAADNLSLVALIQNSDEHAPLTLNNKSTMESTVEAVDVAVEEAVSRSEEMSLESVTLHEDEVLVASLKTEELLQTKSILDEKAEEQVRDLLVLGAENKAETENSSEDESEILTKVLSRWDSLSEDLQELEGESGMLVKELLCHVPPKTPDSVKTSSAYDPAEAMTLESMTLAEVKEEVGGLETEVLLETRNALEEEANVLAKEEKMEVVTVMDDDVFEETPEAEFLTLDSISEAADAIEAETAVVLEAMLGSGQVSAVREAEKESVEKQDGVLEAMSLESVTLAEVEASLGSLENEPLSETINYLETEAEVVAGEKKTEVEVEDVDASGETTDGLFLAEVDALPEDLQIDAVMEELLFSVPAPVTVVTGGLIDREIVKADSLDATVATGSVDVDTAAAVTDDPPASPALKEVLMEEEEKEGAIDEALENEDGKGTHADLDPVQRLFLEKIKEYNNMRRLNGGLMEAEPDYEKHLSEETAKLQRLYGGGDLSSFPQFTFTEPQLDQDSK